METKQITMWGVGPKFTIISLIYAAIVFAIQYIFFLGVRFAIYSKLINTIFGILLIVIGLIIFFIPAFTIDKYFYVASYVKKEFMHIYDILYMDHGFPLSCLVLSY